VRVATALCTTAKARRAAAAATAAAALKMDLVVMEVEHPKRLS